MFAVPKNIKGIMKAYTIDLKEKYGFLQGGKLDCWLGDCPMDTVSKSWKRPALIVVPGGGYGMTSKREGEPIASAFFAKGFQVFILWYLCKPDGARYPEQLLELASAVDYVKKNAAEMSVNPNEVFVVGFSAGGHLSANLAVEYASVPEKAGVALDCKPTAVGLAYPVISSKKGHFGSYINLLDGYTDEAKEELLKTLNLNEAVTKDTPPAFIWTTRTDQAVPCDNGIRYAQALADNGVDFELHVYPRGVHGLSTASLEINPEGAELTSVEHWVSACANFFRFYTVEKF